MSMTPEEQALMHANPATLTAQEQQLRYAIRAREHAEQMRKEAAEEDERRANDPNWAGDGIASRCD
jgi:hypothetical protein